MKVMNLPFKTLPNMTSYKTNKAGVTVHSGSPRKSEVLILIFEPNLFVSLTVDLCVCTCDCVLRLWPVLTSTPGATTVGSWWPSPRAEPPHTSSKTEVGGACERTWWSHTFWFSSRAKQRLVLGNYLSPRDITFPDPTRIYFPNLIVFKP